MQATWLTDDELECSDYGREYTAKALMIRLGAFLCSMGVDFLVGWGLWRLF